MWSWAGGVTFPGLFPQLRMGTLVAAGPSSAEVGARGQRRRWLSFLQVCQVSAQQPVQTELLVRYHQLQSRLATLKIENEEVSEPTAPWGIWLLLGRAQASLGRCVKSSVRCRTIKTMPTKNLSWHGECLCMYAQSCLTLL